MSKPSRFGMVSNFREKAGEVQQEAATPESTTGRGGKSSNTAFEKTTLYLEKDIKLRAQRQLLGSGEDLSTLANRLLADWLEN